MTLAFIEIQAQTTSPLDEITENFHEEIAWFPELISKSSKLPEQLVLPITIDGTSITILATKRTNRSENFQILLQQNDGSFHEMDPGPVNTYRGSIKEYPDHLLGVIVTQEGIYANILTPSNKTIEIAPSGNQKYQIQLAKSNFDTHQTNCKVTDLKGQDDNFPPAQKSAIASKNRGSETVKQAELGFDIAWSAYNARYGRNANDARSNIDLFTNNVMNTIWIRDVMVEHVIGKVIIRTSASACPYEQAGNRNVSNASLNQIKNIWNSGAHGNTHDLATLQVGGGGGGLAWVGKINETLRYSVTDGGSKHAWRGFNRHEIGHTWGLVHGHGRPELKPNGEAFGIMRGGPHDRATSDEAKTMIDERNSSNLKDIGPYRTSNIRPYGNRDWTTVRKGSSITIDVLANDYDANRDAISIVTFDNTGKKGGTIRRGNGNTLVYTASGNVGEDRFYYTLTDGKLNNWGVVHVNVTPSANNCNWINKPGRATDIGAGSNKVFVVGTDRSIHRYNNGSWINMRRENSKRVDVAYGSPYVLITNNDIYRNINNNGWQKLPGQGLDIGGSTNGLCVIGTNSKIYKYNSGGNWSQVKGTSGKRIDVTPQGDPWIVGIDDHIYQYLGNNNWGKKGNFKASDITISGSGTIWALQLGTGIPFKYKGGGVWEKFKGILTSIAAQDNGNLWGTNGNTNIYENTCPDNKISSQLVSDDISNSSEIDVSIYPNPASEKVFIEIPAMEKREVSVQLIEVSGRIIKRAATPYDQGMQMDVSTITNGLYILRIVVQGKQPVNKPILIQ